MKKHFLLFWQSLKFINIERFKSISLWIKVTLRIVINLKYGK